MSEQEFAEIDTPGRFDLVDGELWSMAPARYPHGRFGNRIAFALTSFVNSTGAGEVVTNEVGFVLEPDSRTILCPDVAFISTSRLPTAEDTGFFHGAPDLAVEVISESERPRDILTKVVRYLTAGTAMVWCVYPNQQQVVVHHQESPLRIFTVGETLTGEPVLPGFELKLSDLFGPAPAGE